MNTKSASRWLAACIAVTSPTVADVPVQAQTTNVDQYGDPLPIGAIARLGTVRLRTASSPTGVSFSPDGKRLAACSWSPVIPVWDVETADPLQPYRTDPAGEVMAVRYSPDGKYVVAVGARGEVWVWDADSHEQLWSAAEHDGRTYGIAFSPDGTTLATAGGMDEPTVKLWSIADGKPLHTTVIDETIGDDLPIDFAPDGKRLAYAWRGKIEVLDLSDKQVVTTIDRPFRREVTSLWFVDDGQSLLATGFGYDRLDEPRNGVELVARPAIKQFDAATGELEQELPVPETVAHDPKLVPHPDGKSYVYFGRHGIYVSNLSDGRVHKEIPLEENTWGMRSGAVALQPNGGPWSAHIRTHQIRLINLESGKELHRDLHGLANEVSALAAAPDGETVVTGGFLGRVIEWRASTGELVRELPGLESTVRSLAFTPDGERLLMAGEARDDNGRFVGEAKVYELAAGEVTWRHEVGGRVQATAISADGQRCAVAQGIGRGSSFGSPEPINQVEVRQLATGKVTHTFDSFDSRPLAVAFVDGGKALRLWTEDRQMRQWTLEDSQSAEPVDLLIGSGKSYTTHLSIDGGGSVVAASGIEYPPPNEGVAVARSLQQKGWVGLYDVERGGFRWVEELGFDLPYPTAVSPDGRFVAAFQRTPREAGGDKSIVFRRGSDGAMVWVFPVDDVDFSSLAFTADNHRLIGGTNRGDAIVWDLSMMGNLQ